MIVINYSVVLRLESFLYVLSLILLFLMKDVGINAGKIEFISAKPTMDFLSFKSFMASSSSSEYNSRPIWSRCPLWSPPIILPAPLISKSELAIENPPPKSENLAMPLTFCAISDIA